MQSKLIVGSLSSQYNYIWQFLGLREKKIEKRVEPATGPEISRDNKLDEYDQLAALANKTDLLLIKPSKASLGVEDVQTLFEFAFKKPILSDQALAVMFNFELATTQTQNKLLKLLEEPADYLQIVLCASDERKILATIKSRCEKIILTDSTSGQERENNIFTDRAGELLTEILRDPKSIYTQLEPFLAEQKENPDKNAFWKELALQIGQRALQTVGIAVDTNGTTASVNPGKLLAISSQLYRQASTSVNQKLIADSLYVRLSSNN
jgi:hypothetical protein